MVQKRIALVPCHKRQNGQCDVCKMSRKILSRKKKNVFCTQMQTTRNGRLKALQMAGNGLQARIDRKAEREKNCQRSTVKPGNSTEQLFSESVFIQSQNK